MPALKVTTVGSSSGLILRASYAYGLPRNHGFMDGIKRIGWVAAGLFLADNGSILHYEPLEAIQTVEAVAAGAVPEKGSGRLVPRKAKAAGTRIV